MGRIVLVFRLAARDVRLRPVQAVLMLLAIATGSATLTLALALHGVTSQPYERTRAATKGPDVVAEYGPSQRPGGGSPDPRSLPQTQALIHAPGVTGYSGPYQIAGVMVATRNVTAWSEAQGRDPAPASVDQPMVTTGTWVRPGRVVLERTFAGALHIGVGDRITLSGRPFTVAGLAVTAANPPYPNLCATRCDFATGNAQILADANPGLIWLTGSDLRRVATSATAPSYVLNLRLNDPAAAPAFVSAYENSHPAASAGGALTAWQDVSAADGLLVQDEQQVLTPGSWLLLLLSVASVAVLVGGRIAERTRRVGLLKAAGGTPGLVGVVLLAENLAVALAAAASGLMAGWLTAPLTTDPGTGLVGAPGAPSLTLPDAGLVVAAALAVALTATLVPALRAARTSTVGALADAARPPRRRAMLTSLSRRLPVPLLLGVRIVSRRPRRAVLGAASIAVTVTGVVAVLAFQATADGTSFGGPNGLSNPVYQRDQQMLLVLTVMLFAVANSGGMVTVPPTWWLVAAVAGTLVAVAGLAAIPARIGAGRPVTEILQAEAA